MSNIKNFCYRNDCEIVVTGAVQSTWYVCRACKTEVSESYYNNYKDDLARKEDRKKKEAEEKDKQDDDQESYLWGI